MGSNLSSELKVENINRLAFILGYLHLVLIKIWIFRHENMYQAPLGIC